MPTSDCNSLLIGNVTAVLFWTILITDNKKMWLFKLALPVKWFLFIYLNHK